MTASDGFYYEFGGPVGTFACTAILPIVTLLLVHWADVGRLDFSFLNDFFTKRFWDAFLSSPVLCPECGDINLLGKCTSGVLCWFLFQVLLERLLPGAIAQGAPVKGDKDNRLSYRLNGHLAYWVTLMFVEVGYPSFHEESGYWQFQRFPMASIMDHIAVYAFVTCLLCFLFSFYLYMSSFAGNLILSDVGTSGNPFYDFWMGRELNPRWGSFDWKQFCELRPGLIGWMFLNLCCVAKQYENLGYVTGSMILVNVFQGIYVWDALFNERAILTTVDITTEGFGFMLCFGDLAWVPFTYSVQAQYLVKHDPHLSYAALAAILAVHVVGFSLFRGANGQKDAFRRDPNDPNLSHLKFLKTKRGTKLLTSGFWGMARKINYTGDYLMGLSWCLVCGFGSLVPYYYSVYFGILLVHRAMRDDHMCKEKYGDDWNTYKKMVPYIFIPGIF